MWGVGGNLNGIFQGNLGEVNLVVLLQSLADPPLLMPPSRETLQEVRIRGRYKISRGG